MTNNPRVKLISRIYLGTLGILSAWFLATLAMADPKCAGCSVDLVMWAMSRAEILTGAWIIAGVGTLWGTRRSTFAFCVKVWRVVNRSSATESNQ